MRKNSENDFMNEIESIIFLHQCKSAVWHRLPIGETVSIWVFRRCILRLCHWQVTWTHIVLKCWILYATRDEKIFSEILSMKPPTSYFDRTISISISLMCRLRDELLWSCTFDIAEMVCRKADARALCTTERVSDWDVHEHFDHRTKAVDTLMASADGYCTFSLANPHFDSAISVPALNGVDTPFVVLFF